ncbi:MAG: TRAP transporter small permease [Agathobaculum sp.]|jgi:C4-dicarboxylate transporter DctQ subunit|uniref:TRAP transporter small permease n=1 Tax=Agathobaculum sp. TaxID=2048138 RepID=UPI003D93E98D
MKQQQNWKVWLLNIDVVIASVAMCLLVGVTFGGVVSRYILGMPFSWIEEVQAALIIWVIFGAAGAAFRTANHAAIEVFYEFFPKALKKVINVLILIVTVLTLVFLGYLSIQYMNVFAASGRTTAILHISYIAIYCIVPVSCIWQVFNFILVNFFHYTEQETIEAITDEEFEEAKK